MKVHISKLDAAKRQLNTAIHYFFQGGDPVLIHTLTGASFQIIEDICTKRGLSSHHQSLLMNVREERRDEVKIRLGKAKNFFKHADKDPDGIIEFNPDSTAFYIWNAVGLYKSLTGENVPLFGAFLIWFSAKYPEIMIPDDKRDETSEALRSLNLDPNRPESFLPIIPYLEESLHKIKLKNLSNLTT